MEMRRLRSGLLLSSLSMLLAPAACAAGPAFVVVPPGPVATGARLELRLALDNPADAAATAHAAFFLDTVTPAAAMGETTIEIPAHGSALARGWGRAAAAPGKHEIRYKVRVRDIVSEGQWPIEIVDAPTRALPLLQGMWIEPFAIHQCAADSQPETVRRVINDSVAAMDRLGVRILIVAYVEYLGQFFYPTDIAFFDADVQRTSRGADCRFDTVGAILDEARARGMHVMLGLGRAGDTHLLWEFDKPGWDARNASAVAAAQRVARDLHARYGADPAFYGWYLTHEMNDLAKAGAYYDPVARYCHELAPQMPVLAAPAGTPIATPEQIAASEVDIFAYQDAVGAGYVPYEYTYRPEKRIAALDELYKTYSAWHADAGKHVWSDLEVWEMDGNQGYAGAYAAPFARVKQQIEIESRHAEVLTGYAYHGYLQAPGSPAEKPNARAQTLYTGYRAYVRTAFPTLIGK
ncbi:MAG: DUF4434 domain-containing protein [Candidatus Hydrogenedentes bacterium]|nr:DUF4434 domain-containing protein [Candidatus Hydrogenedentota bacterium]